MLKNYSIFIIIAVFGFACKSQWKKTAQIPFELEIVIQSSSSPYLIFESGELSFSEFSFYGNRTQSSEIEFQDDFEGEIKKINLATSEKSFLDQYDIPQGTYSEIKTKLILSPDEATQNSVKLVGYFKDVARSSNIRVEFYVNKSFEIDMQAQNEDAHDNSGIDIVAEENEKHNEAVISINAADWFSLVSANMLHNASKTSINGKPTIIISEFSNANIYDLVIGRVNLNSKTTFK